MKRFLKLLIRFTFYGSVLIFSFFLWALHVYEKSNPEEKLKPVLEQAFSHFLHRRLTIETLSYGLRPRPALIGANVKLYENDGRLMAVSPKVHMYLSLESLINKNIDIREIEFRNGVGTIRRAKSGELDLVRMINEIRYSLSHPAPDDLQSLDYQFRRFTITRCRFYLIDERLKTEPLHTTFMVDATGDITGETGHRTFPFSVSANVQHPKRHGRFDMNGVLGAPTQLTLHSPSFPLQFFSEYFPLLSKWNGDVSIHADLTETPSGYAWNAIGGSVNPKPLRSGEFPDLYIAYQVHSATTSVITLDLQGTKTEAEFEVSIPNLSQHVMSIAMTSSHVDVDQLLSYWKTASPDKQDAIVASPNPELSEMNAIPEVMEKVSDTPFWTISSTIKSQNVVFHGDRVENVSVQLVQHSSGNVKINQFDMAGLGGELQAKGELQYPPGRVFFSSSVFSSPTLFNVEWNLSNLDLMRLNRILGIEQVCSGRVLSKGHLTGNLNDWRGKESSGEIHLTASHGIVWGVPGLLKTFTKLNVHSLFKHTDGKEKEGLAYNVAQATVTIHEGKLLVNPPAIFESDTLQLAFMGSVNIVQNKVDGDIVINFLTVIGEAVGAIPGVRTILLGDRKSIVPIWVHIRGPLDDPELDFRAFKTFTDPIKNVVKRIFRFPVSIFTK